MMRQRLCRFSMSFLLLSLSATAFAQKPAQSASSGIRFNYVEERYDNKFRIECHDEPTSLATLQELQTKPICGILQGPHRVVGTFSSLIGVGTPSYFFMKVVDDKVVLRVYFFDFFGKGHDFTEVEFNPQTRRLTAHLEGQFELDVVFEKNFEGFRGVVNSDLGYWGTVDAKRIQIPYRLLSYPEELHSLPNQ